MGESEIRPNESGGWSGVDSPLLRRIGAGIVSAVANAIPVPWVGGHLASRCDQFVVETALKGTDSKLATKQFQQLYAHDTGWRFSSIPRRIVKLPLLLLSYPIRSLLATAKMIKEVPLAVIRSVLLGRTLDRALANNFLLNPPEMSGIEFSRRVGCMRTSFDQAFSSIHWDFAKAAIADAMSQASWWRATVSRLLARYRDGESALESEVRNDEGLRNEASKIRDAIEQPGVLQLFDSFDEQFDLHLSALVGEWASCVKASKTKDG